MVLPLPLRTVGHVARLLRLFPSNGAFFEKKQKERKKKEKRMQKERNCVTAAEGQQNLDDRMISTKDKKKRTFL